MLDKQIDIGGVKVPSIVVYALAGFAVYYIGSSFKNGVSGGLANLFKSDTQKQEDAVLKDIFKSLEKNEAVISQKTTLSGGMANTLYDCMHGIGTRTQGIYDVFRKITGPNQMGAIFLLYGKRALGVTSVTTLLSSFDGDLVGALNSELSKSELEKNIELDSKKPKWSVNDKLNWLKNF